jgi:hypothetical protein
MPVATCAYLLFCSCSCFLGSNLGSPSPQFRCQQEMATMTGSFGALGFENVYQMLNFLDTLRS